MCDSHLYTKVQFIWSLHFNRDTKWRRNSWDFRTLKTGFSEFQEIAQKILVKRLPGKARILDSFPLKVH